MRLVALSAVVLLAIFVSGCSTPAARIKNIQLGMTPEEVLKSVGSPYTKRAGKVYEDGRTTEVWEYIAKIAVFPKDYWIYFENNRVVQWGEPGDFSGLTQKDSPVSEYKPARMKN